MITHATWPHYHDLPYEVVCVRVAADGTVASEELIARHWLESEATHALARSRRNLINRANFRVELRDVRLTGEAMQ